MWSRFIKTVKRELRLEKEFLTPQMCEEIDRLGLSRSVFQQIVDDDGLGFAQYCLAERTKESRLFEYWYPRLTEFVRTKRSQFPFPTNESLDPIEAATRRILEPKICGDERVPCAGNFKAAIFSAPLHVLPYVASLWPSRYRHPVFLTSDESAEWWNIYRAEVSEQESSSWWYVVQHWNAEVAPASDSKWVNDGRTKFVYDARISWGLSWGTLFGGQDTELWGLAADGKETFVALVESVQY